MMIAFELFATDASNDIELRYIDTSYTLILLMYSPLVLRVAESSDNQHREPEREEDDELQVEHSSPEQTVQPLLLHNLNHLLERMAFVNGRDGEAERERERARVFVCV